MRWIWIDRFETIAKGRHARACKNLTLGEDFLLDPGLGFPFFPGSLMIEMIAQTGGVLAGATIDFKKEVVLAKIEWARFGEPVAPPAALTVEAELKECRPEGSRASGRVLFEGRTVAEAEIMFLHLDKLFPEQSHPVVFHPRFMEFFQIESVVSRGS